MASVIQKKRCQMPKVVHLSPDIHTQNRHYIPPLHCKNILFCFALQLPYTNFA